MCSYFLTCKSFYFSQLTTVNKEGTMLIDQQRAIELGEAIIDAAEITKKQGVPTYVMPMNNTFIAVKRNLGGDDYVDPDYLLYIES